MTWLLDFINSFFSILWKGFLWIVEAIGTVIGFLLYTIYDGVLLVIHAFASLIDLSVVAFNMTATAANLPPQMIWIINQIAIPQGLMIVGGAITIRMLLNLIPAAFSRI